MPYWLRPITEIFNDYSPYVLDAADIAKHRIFIDRNSEVLFVAHLDTVLAPHLRVASSLVWKRLYAQGLDDRLGCCTAAILAEHLGVDLLLTDYEEACRSTAKYHKLKDYNWIAEFDREGQDVVTYGLDSVEFLNALKDYWAIGIGSFSDLCVMRTSACCVNIGLGHKLSHDINSYVCLDVLEKQIKKFLMFYETYKNTKFEQDYPQSNYWNVDAARSEINTCEICGFKDGENVYGYYICRECFLELFERMFQ